MIDAHLHLWKIDKLTYPWINDLPSLNRNFLIEDYLDATKNQNIEAMVFVQCDCLKEQSIDEVKMISDFAQQDKRIQGIVAFAPLDEPNKLDSYLQQLVQFPLVKGVRRLTQGEELGFSCTKKMIEGTKKISTYNLTSDICIKQEQLPDIIELVKNCPKNTFILDHIAKPNIKQGNTDKWFNDLKNLSYFQNVYCKISGVITEASENWTTESIKPYILHAINCFGEDRILYGGDWPVVNLVDNYQSWYKALQEILDETTIDRQKLMTSNAQKAYQLNA